MRLRVRSRTGVQNLAVDPSVSLAALKTQLHASQLRTGFPPRLLDAPDATPLSDILRDGDLIVVQSDAAATATAATATAAPAAPAPPRPAAPPASIASQGRFHVREVPDDNSCLFRSIAHVLQTGATPSSLRDVVADRVQRAPDEYSSAVLGRAPAAYAAWIRGDAAWGGAIELSILAAHAGVQFAAFDVHTMRLDRYPHDAAYATVAYLVYDGIHYNYAALAVPAVGDVTQFDPTDAHVLDGVKQLAQRLHDARQYTDTASFTLVCNDCGVKFRGEKEALEHAQSTTHANFKEA